MHGGGLSWKTANKIVSCGIPHRGQLASGEELRSKVEIQGVLGQVDIQDRCIVNLPEE
jgi:hypothetical protein